MSPERWQQINEVFQSVVELESDEQDDYLDKACADDESLRQQVETLLAANQNAGTFIAGNAANDAAHLLTLKNSPTLTGERLGHYEIISVLGTGGMGKVYLAKDSKLNRSIAVKTLPTSFSGDSDHLKRFQTEAKAAAKLNHPNVATIYSVEETDDDQTFITMEYVEGKSLNEMIPENGFDLRTFLDIFISISDALAHAHEKGIVHRDIKPSNVMITPTGNPKILDFGLARIDKSKLGNEDSTLSLTQTGQVLGTPAYMSPEQAEGKEADHRTDIFSLGVVMYEAITGERPFKGDNYAAIVSKLLNEEPKNVAELKPKAPFMLSRLIMKCLNKEPHYRYQSMNEVRVLLKEINSAIDSGASLSRPEQISANTVSKGISPIYLIAGLGLLSLLGFFALWTWFSSNDTNSKQTFKFNLVGDKATKLSVLSTKFSPDGKSFVFSDLQSKKEKVYIRNFDSFEIKPVPGTEEAKFPFFSPDGEWIAFNTDTDRILKVPLKGGDPILVCEGCQTLRVGHWGTDGYIYYNTPEQGLNRVSADGGKPEELTTVNKEKGELSHNQASLLPDEKNVLFTVTNTEGLELGLLNLETKKWEYIKEAGEGWHSSYVSTGHIVFARDRQLMAMPFDSSTAKPTGKPKLIINGLFVQAPNIQVSNNGTLTFIPNIIRTQNQIVWVDRNGKATPAIKEKGDFSSPKISPDGKRIITTFNGDVWNYDIESGSKVRISDDGRSEIPMWSLDGKSIFYVAPNDKGFGIYKKSADGTGDAEEIHNEKFRLIPYSIHPTENLLSLVSRQNVSDLYVKSLKDNSIKPVVKTKFGEDTPRFSPDGKWFVYSSMDTGKPQIYVHPWNNFSKKIPVTKEAGMFPVWSKDGKELFYRLGSRFFSIDINTSQGFSVSEPKTLFQGKYLTSFDVSPDGQRFLLVRDEHGTLPTKLNVILNWTEELKQKMSE